MCITKTPAQFSPALALFGGFPLFSIYWYCQLYALWEITLSDKWKKCSKTQLKHCVVNSPWNPLAYSWFSKLARKSGLDQWCSWFVNSSNTIMLWFSLYYNITKTQVIIFSNYHLSRWIISLLPTIKGIEIQMANMSKIAWLVQRGVVKNNKCCCKWLKQYPLTVPSNMTLTPSFTE